MSPPSMKALSAQVSIKGTKTIVKAHRRAACAQQLRPSRDSGASRAGGAGLSRVRRVFVEIEGLVPMGSGGVLVHARLRYGWSFPVYLSRCEGGMGLCAPAAGAPPRLGSQTWRNAPKWEGRALDAPGSNLARAHSSRRVFFAAPITTTAST